ncbi:MAG: LPS export ABC transporter periplasmic protein LptC [Caldimicrobium sp.]
MGYLSKGLFINFLLINILLAQEPLEIKISSLTYQRYEGSNLVWKLFSENFWQKNKETFEAKGIYLENLPKGLRIWAKEAIYLKGEEKFILRGKVRLITEKEGEVFTEELIFYPKKNLLFAPGQVLIKKEGIQVSGEGLTYSVGEGSFQLHKRAKAQFKL